MEMTPGRAPFTEDEDYTPLRMPKSANASPTHAAGTAAADGRTASPSKLSPFAKVFVPRFGAAAGGATAGDDQPQSTTVAAAAPPPPQPHVPYYQRPQYQQQKHQQQQQQQQQQWYNNSGQGGYRRPQYVMGYKDDYEQGEQNAFQLQGHSSNAHHAPHMPKQMYNAQMNSLSSSVQERLKIGNNSGGGGNHRHSGGVFYNSPHHHQPSQSSHHHHHQQQQPQQPRHKYHNHNHSHNHHHQQQQPRYPRHMNHSSNHAGGAGSSNSEAKTARFEASILECLKTVMSCLNENPGQFDEIATQVLHIFDGMENNQNVLSNAMEDIFQESIQNPNFRYMGAKLYNLLHSLNLKKDSLFHTLLKCKLDYHQQEVLQFMASNQEQKVRETALFLAELYMQLRGDNTRIRLIADNIVYSLKQLLTKESAENVRSICLTLKLAGYDLTADCQQDMIDIMAQVEAIDAKSPGKYALAANVLALQKNNWGRKVASTSLCESEPDADLAKGAEPLRASDEPIFYGPDGWELTAEEKDFLTNGTITYVDGSTSLDDEDDELVDFDTEMDEDTEKAYVEFCKLNATTS